MQLAGATAGHRRLRATAVLSRDGLGGHPPRPATPGKDGEDAVGLLTR